MSDAQRLPPYEKEAEEALLGCIIIDPHCLHEVSAIVEPQDFYHSVRGSTYRIMLELYESGKDIDFVSIASGIRKLDLMEEGEAESYCIDLMNAVPTSVNALTYAQLIAETSRRRALIQGASKAAELAYDEDKPLSEVIDEAERLVMGVRRNERRVSFRSSEDVADELMTDIHDETPAGISSGLIDLDKCIGGLEEGFGYWFLGAEKMGKTALISTISLHVARQGGVVLRISAEMSGKQRMRRDAAALTGISIQKIKRKQFENGEQSELYNAIGRLSDLKIEYEETPGVTPSQVRAACHRTLMKYGRIDLIEVDYYQKMNADKSRSNRSSELEEISAQLHDLIKEKQISCPLIGAGQVLSKSIDTRNDKRPYASDVFGSSQLMKDAFMMAYLYRESYYYPESGAEGEAELIVRLHRDGDTPTIYLQFEGPTAHFRNAAYLSDQKQAKTHAASSLEGMGELL